MSDHFSNETQDGWDNVDIVRGRIEATPKGFATGGIVPAPTTFLLDNSDGCVIPVMRGEHLFTSAWGHSVTFTVAQPRPWWRRLLRLPAKKITRGPYRLEPWLGKDEATNGEREGT